ncbi:hypothetical protein [Gimibacter soli]|uniref:Uncharacterized protein n=1 Tax=Gimibacter soli TaxID=3024400 RepID=A0AAE9XVY8_9PROT|nr:hypothetical protein [Gimibacter soli]WCL55113.1 hypothetical protein PH603_04995 [Gimibacter soli]
MKPPFQHGKQIDKRATQIFREISKPANLQEVDQIFRITARAGQNDKRRCLHIDIAFGKRPLTNRPQSASRPQIILDRKHNLPGEPPPQFPYNGPLVNQRKDVGTPHASQRLFLDQLFRPHNPAGQFRTDKCLKGALQLLIDDKKVDRFQPPEKARHTPCLKARHQRIELIANHRRLCSFPRFHQMPKTTPADSAS